MPLAYATAQAGGTQLGRHRRGGGMLASTFCRYFHTGALRDYTDGRAWKDYAMRRPLMVRDLIAAWGKGEGQTGKG